MTRFDLAPMSTSIRWLTAGLLALPVVLLAVGHEWVGLGLAALYSAIFFWWRPHAFELSPQALHIRFPFRTRTVPGEQLVSARVISSETFHAEHGLALRVGAGGLWGGFGWLWTRKRGWVEFYVSRSKGLVLVERRGGNSILLTPADPERFAASL